MVHDRSSRSRIRQLPVGPPGSGPYALTAGLNGALWITLVHAGQIARLEPGGHLDLYKLDSATCRPSQITVGPESALWSTRPGDDRIGRITTSGETAAFTVTAGSAPFGITVGPFDGALWFTLNQAHAIGRLSVDGDASIYSLPTPDAGPVGIAATSDSIWFVEIAAGQVGYISLDDGIHEFALPDRTARPHAIVADPHDGCWLSEWGNSRIARVTADGHLREVILPAASEPHGLTIGPDGALWVALETGSAARIDI